MNVVVGELGPQQGNGRAVRAPACFPNVVGHLGAAGAVDVHVPCAAARGGALARIDEKGDLRTVGRDVGIQFVDVGRLRQVH